MNETQMQPAWRPVGRQRNPAEEGCIHLPSLHVPHQARRPKTSPTKLYILAAFLFGLTPYIFHLADLERGMQGTGGEMFVPIVAAVLVGVTDGVLLVSYGDNITGYKQPKGDFIDWQKTYNDLCEKEVNYTICINPDHMIAALQSARPHHVRTSS